MAKEGVLWTVSEKLKREETRKTKKWPKRMFCKGECQKSNQWAQANSRIECHSSCNYQANLTIKQAMQKFLPIQDNKLCFPNIYLMPNFGFQIYIWCQWDLLQAARVWFHWTVYGPAGKGKKGGVVGTVQKFPNPKIQDLLRRNSTKVMCLNSALGKFVLFYILKDKSLIKYSMGLTSPLWKWSNVGCVQ